MRQGQELKAVLSAGEGPTVEFKESLGHIDREMVAFANGQGGSLFLGVTDDARAVGIRIDNRLLSRVQDIARNCDPPVRVETRRRGDVLEIAVEEGDDKPYRCRDGFYLRVGPNSQKLRRDEIIDLVVSEGRVRFDERFCRRFSIERDLSEDRLRDFLARASVQTRHLEPQDLLASLGVAELSGDQVRIRNAGVLFFAKEPQRFFPGSHFTCVRYQGPDRHGILDRRDLQGSPVEQIVGAFAFFQEHVGVEYRIGEDARRRELLRYPLEAVREAITNSVMHRDYAFTESNAYLHFFSDRLEIENPGGLARGLTMEDLGKRSVRRNPLVSDLLLRAGYVEQLGSGIQRMQIALERNGNPPFEVSATDFFVMRFLPRVPGVDGIRLTVRQRRLLQFLEENPRAATTECAAWLRTSADTALRELRRLMEARLVAREGVGRATVYRPTDPSER